MNRQKKIAWTRLALLTAALIVVNVLIQGVYWRIDLTGDKRFTISKPSKNILKRLDDKVYFRIFLAGDLPAEYRRLKVAISDMLDEYAAYSGHQVLYEFYNPFDLDDEKAVNAELKSITQSGVIPRPIARTEMGELTQKVIIPGAIVSYKGREIPLNFLPPSKALTENDVEVVNAAISTLEYKMSSAIARLMATRKKKVLFTEGHGELPRANIADMGITLQEAQYDVSFIDLREAVGIPPLTDLIIIAKPTQPFSEKDKFKIDQYIMHGGKVLWLVDGMKADLDSLAGKEEFLAMDLPLNLEDQLFEYGVRINKDLLLDKRCNPLPLFSQNGKIKNYYPWYFFPIVFSNSRHPVVKHLDPVMMRFASTMDTIEVPEVKKTVLLASSNESTAWKTPVLVRLALARTPPLDEQFRSRDLPVAVLLEGRFRSLYENRIPEKTLRIYRDSLGLEFKSRSADNKMIIVSDGDVIRNEYTREGKIIPLGQYRFNPKAYFGNRDFLMNCVDYLTDEYGLIETRSKDFKVHPLNTEVLRKSLWRWQLAVLAIPLISLLIFAFVYTLMRKKKYTGSL